ncbi:MAG: glycerol-3-phosphate 1-O-acyltransferase [Acidimicrobiales bacterium]
MTDTERWPVPSGEPGVLLLDTSTDVEREVLASWIAEHRPGPADPIDEVALPDPAAAHLDGLTASLGDTADPWLAPLRVAWLPEEHDGERTVRLRDVVRTLGDPRHPRSAAQRRIVRDEPQRCQVVVGEPARVSDLRARWESVAGDAPSPDGFAPFVARQATLALERAESRLVGASYKVPRLVREELMATARFRDGVAALAAELERDEDEVRREAESYLEEMVTGWTRLLVDLYVRFGRHTFERGYEPELDLDPEQVARLQAVATDSPLVFLPSHKSNLDTLVMNVALHDSGLPRTHVFGGINMAFWPMGSVFRRAGTAFIRRDTRGKPVYNFALREYIGYLVEKRFSLQFYAEGGRSRTGKLLPPKLGLLAYIADAYKQGRSDDVLLVPVSIAYDQLQEVGEFAREAKGESKAAESIGWVLRAIREQRGRYGRIYVRFAEPLSLRHALGPPDGASLDDDDDRLALQKAALEVSRRINEVTPITATSLVTLSLLGAQGRALTIDQIRATVHDPLEYARRRGLPLTRNVHLDTDTGLRQVLGELERHKVVARHAAGPDDVFSLGEDQHLAAAFYRNSVIHFFLHGALAQAALARVVDQPAEDTTETFWTTVLEARDLLKFEFFFEPRDEFRSAIAAELSSHARDWDERLASGPHGAAKLLGDLRPLTAHTVLRSFLEAYLVVAATLVRHTGEDVNDKELLASCLGLGRQYQLQQRIHSPESLARPLFSNALQLAKSRGLTDTTATVADRQQLHDEIRSILSDLDVVELVAMTRVMRLINGEDEPPPT